MDSQAGNQVVLVIDDDAEWRDFVGTALSESYSLRFAASGEAGLRIARQAQPDAIILDVIMPEGRDGFSVLCELRDSEETKSIPVIMLTSVNEMSGTSFDEEILRQHLGRAPSAFLEKPIDLELLQQKVSSVIAESCAGAPGQDGVAD